MPSLKKYLLPISLSPLLLVITISAFNLNDKIRVRFLIWESPLMPLGTILVLTSSGSAILTSALSLSFSNQEIKLRRTVKQEVNSSRPDSEFRYDFENKTNNDLKKEDQLSYQQYLKRDVRDPSPTVSVPYRVVTTRNNVRDIDYEYHQTDQVVNNDYNPEEDFNPKTDGNYSLNGDWGDLLPENW